MIEPDEARLLAALVAPLLRDVALLFLFLACAGVFDFAVGESIVGVRLVRERTEAELSSVSSALDEAESSASASSLIALAAAGVRGFRPKGSAGCCGSAGVGSCSAPAPAVRRTPESRSL